MSALSAIVLAAGSGSRMRSARPKPLHPLCGKPMLVYVLESLQQLDLRRRLVVVGAGAELISKKLVEVAPDISVELVHQPSPLGTGPAVATALGAFDPFDDLDETDDVLVVPADVPLVQPSTLQRLVDEHRTSGAAASVLTVEAAPGRAGYGAVVAGRAGEVGAIVRDLAPDAAPAEVAVGVFCFRRSLLAPALRRVYPDESLGEMMLADVIEVLHDTGHRTISCRAVDSAELRGVNDRADLAAVEAALRDRINAVWLRRGVTMVDPSRTIVDTTVDLAADVTLFPGTLLQGDTVIGAGAEVGPDTHLVDCAVGQDARVRQTVGRDAEIGAFADVGPFAVLEPGASVAPATTTGPFHVESAANEGSTPS